MFNLVSTPVQCMYEAAERDHVKIQSEVTSVHYSY